MSKAVHTPGPWAVSDQNSLDIEADGEKIATTAITQDLNAYQQCQADAHLIAAAPELLAALETVTDWLETELEDADAHVRDNAGLTAALAILAKARGEG